MTEEKPIGRFDESLQRLYMEYSKGQPENWHAVQANIRGRDFFRPGPLMRALECDRPCVLLVDEKVDESFEAFLLEVLAEWQLSIPEFGTITAKSIPFVVLTSNEERTLGDPDAPGPLKINLRPLIETWPKAGRFCMSLAPRIASTRINRWSFILDGTRVVPAPSGATCPDCVPHTAPV